ncbi:hypothetical protein J4233_02630 [Candidatus Pacearchaeota archaeon]|nr:hypothetical protein [Candidatus Pacearchaeota archaeon]
MTSLLELRVRELDDPTKPIKQVAREIAPLVRLSKDTIIGYVRAGRNDQSHYERLQKQAIERGTTLREAQKASIVRNYGSISWWRQLNLDRWGIETASDYEDFIAREDYGFESHAQLIAFKKRKPIPELKGKQKKNECWGDFVQPMSPDDLDRLPEANSFSFDEAQRTVNLAQEILSSVERKTIRKRYYEKREKTLKEIGEEFGVTGERIRQIEAAALAKMRAYIEQNGLADYYR